MTLFPQCSKPFSGSASPKMTALQNTTIVTRASKMLLSANFRAKCRITKRAWIHPKTYSSTFRCRCNLVWAESNEVEMILLWIDWGMSAKSAERGMVRTLDKPIRSSFDKSFAEVEDEDPRIVDASRLSAFRMLRSESRSSSRSFSASWWRTVEKVDRQDGFLRMLLSESEEVLDFVAILPANLKNISAAIPFIIQFIFHALNGNYSN